jgi:hypothetical protein
MTGEIAMPRINVSLNGWLTGAAVNTVTVAGTAEVLDVSDRTPEEVMTKIETGEWLLDVSAAISDCDSSYFDVFDCEEYGK